MNGSSVWTAAKVAAVLAGLAACQGDPGFEFRVRAFPVKASSVVEVNAAEITRIDGELMFAVQYQSYQEAMASPEFKLSVTSDTGTVDAHIRPGYCYRFLTPRPTSLDLEGVTISLPESGTLPGNDFVSLECVHGAVVQMVVN